MLKRAIPKPTPEQQARQDKCRQFGCVACRMDRLNLLGPFEIHHLTKSGRQIGQDETVCLCGWHHRGICCEGWTSTEMKIAFGPSLAKGSKTFHAHFGSNEELLRYQNELIA